MCFKILVFIFSFLWVDLDTGLTGVGIGSKEGLERREAALETKQKVVVSGVL